MLKKLLVIFLLFFLVVPILTACSEQDSPIPWDRIEINEYNETEYAGYYFITRENLGQKWEEWGEWKPIQILYQNTTVCFGFFPEPLKGYFVSHPDFEWVEVTQGGRNCLQLKHKK